MKWSFFKTVLLLTALAAVLTILSTFRGLQVQPDAGPPSASVDLQPDENEEEESAEAAPSSETWIILLAFQRSGTHYLTQELSRHPCMYVAGEILLAPGLKEDWWSPQKRRAGIKTFYNISLSAEEKTLELPEVSAQWASESSKALAEGKMIRGFNWKVSQGFLQDLPWIEEFIATHQVRLIWLQRRNMLRRYLSMQSNRRFFVAATTDKSEASRIKKEKNPIPVEKMLKDFKAREAEVKQLHHFFKTLESKGHHVLQVTYEDLSASMDTIRAWAVNGVTACRVSGDSVRGDDKDGYQKLHPGNVSDMVEPRQIAWRINRINLHQEQSHSCFKFE